MCNNSNDVSPSVDYHTYFLFRNNILTAAVLLVKQIFYIYYLISEMNDSSSEYMFQSCYEVVTAYCCC